MAIDEQVVWATLGKLVRHDLRSSLSPIIGGIDLLQTGELNATQAKFVAMIQQGGDRIGIYQRRAQALLGWVVIRSMTTWCIRAKWFSNGDVLYMMNFYMRCMSRILMVKRILYGRPIRFYLIG